MPGTWRLRKRIPEKDDPFLLGLIKRELGQYRTARGITDERIYEELNHSTNVVLLYNKQGRRCGFLSWKELGDVLFLGLCVLEKDVQGKGIATAYMKRVEKYAEKNGFHFIRFYVDIENKRALSLYKRLGFKQRKVNPFTSTYLMEKKVIPNQRD